MTGTFGSISRKMNTKVVITLLCAIQLTTAASFGNPNAIINGIEKKIESLENQFTQQLTGLFTIELQVEGALKALNQTKAQVQQGIEQQITQFGDIKVDVSACFKAEEANLTAVVSQANSTIQGFAKQERKKIAPVVENVKSIVSGFKNVTGALREKAENCSTMEFSTAINCYYWVIQSANQLVVPVAQEIIQEKEQAKKISKILFSDLGKIIGQVDQSSTAQFGQVVQDTLACVRSAVSRSEDSDSKQE